MGIFDKAKKLVGKHEKEVKDGIDKVADVVEDKVPDKYDAKVGEAAEKAKDLIDKID